MLAVNTSDAKELGIDWDFQSLTGSADYNRESWTEQRYVTDDTGNVKFDEDGNPRIRNIVHDGWEVDMPEGYAGISYGRSVSGHPYLTGEAFPVIRIPSFSRRSSPPSCRAGKRECWPGRM